MGSIAIAVLGLGVASCQALTTYEQLQDSRAAALKVESDRPIGTKGRPQVWMRIFNLTDHTIPAAQVGAALRLLPPEKVAEIFDHMPVKKEAFQPKAMEPQHLFSGPFTPEQLEQWRTGELVLVGGLSITWKDRSAWTKTNARRCYAWTFTAETACEDLIDHPEDARNQVQRIIATHPNDVAG